MRPNTPSALLKHADCEAFLVTNLTNIRYLTGLDLSAGFLLAQPRRFTLFVDSRYREKAEQSAQRCAVRDIGEAEKLFRDIPRCGFEAEDVTVLRKTAWKKRYPRTMFVQTAGILQAFRRQKDPEELRILRRAQKMTKELLRRVPSLLRKGVTEERIARQLLMWSLELGAEGLSFEPIVAFGTHTSMPHHRSTPRPLQKGNIVQIDVGVKYRGYCGDLSEVFFTGSATRLQERMYSVLCRARDAVMDAAVPGASVQALDRLARDILAEEGVDEFFTHALGHGVGLDVHEGVTLSSKATDAKLLPGEVIAVEPGVYFPGRFGMRVEEMVFVGA